MKKIFFALAISFVAFCSCNKEVNAPVEKKTHTVTFTVADVDTKTSMDESGDKVTFSWTADDLNNFHVFENGIEGLAEAKNTDGVVRVKATFDDTEATTFTYTCFVAGNIENADDVCNPSLLAYQKPSNGVYDPKFDILVAEPVTDQPRSVIDVDNEESAGLAFRFKRVNAINKMTLTNLVAGDQVLYVKLSSESNINGVYNFQEGKWDFSSSEIVVSCAETVPESGELTFCFISAPITSKVLSISVETYDELNYTKTFGGPITLPGSTVNYFSVNLDGCKEVAKVWAAVELSDLEPEDPVVITMKREGVVYALSLTGTDGKAFGTSCTSKAVAIKVDGEELVDEPSSDILWNIYGVDGGFKIYPNTITNKWLYCVTSNSGLRLGDNTNNGYVWSVDSDYDYITINDKADGSGTQRYVGIYYSSTTVDWRAYALSGDNLSSNIAGQTLCFYAKKGAVKTALSAPNNIVVNQKIVSWEEVANAASYELTIGSTVYTVMTNSYNASALDDEYYNVSIVAIPSDTDTYKQSPATSLENVKFGDPTLSAPVLKVGVVDETSATLSWTLDPRATSGYKCEIYIGDEKENEQSVTGAEVTFSNLAENQDYTVKVYAIAVDGLKAYKASTISSASVKTIAATHLSDITAAGTYTVKNLTVMANSSTTSVLSDGTGYILDYGTARTVKQILSVTGNVKKYNGVWEFDNATATKTSEVTTIDYGEAEEINDAFVTSYIASPRITYAHIVGAMSTSANEVEINSTIVNVYGGSSYKGKQIEAYGYTIGYSSTSKINFIPTAIYDRTPTLTVTPTSKNWDSTSTQSVDFTVSSTNGSWDVSDYSIDWATVTVDKANNKITVAPKSENTSTTSDNEGSIEVYHKSNESLKVTISLKQFKSGTSWTAATMAAGTNGSTATVNGNSAIKVGTSSKGGTMTIKVPKGATQLRFYAAAWSGVNGLSLNITPTANVTKTSVALTADSGVSGSSPFTLSGSEDSYLFTIPLNSITAETTITLTSSSAKRFVVWGAESL